LTLDSQNPFAGLQAFGEGDQAFFHGRETEQRELLRLVRRHALTVLFGRSGLGKTSLLQAGLSPLLRDASFVTVPVRLDFTPGDSLEGRIKDRVGEVLREHGIDAPPVDRSSTLWEYFHQARWWNARNRLLTPVLIIDQFEEIFTLGRGDGRITPLLTELADLIENRIPAVVRERQTDRELPFSYDRQSVRVVLSLREDFLPHLEGLRPLIPSIARNRFRLTAMRGAQALESILRPAGALVSEDVALEILHIVTGEDQDRAPLEELEVEPALLSLFCREINERRLEHGLPSITTELVRTARGRILSDFYDRGFAGLDPELRSFIEERLLTTSGFRHSEPLEEALGRPGVTGEAISRLVDRRLLRLEPRLGRLHVELIHDVLTAVVQESRDRRRSRERRRRQIRRVAAALVLLGGLASAIGMAAVRDLRLRREAEEDRVQAEKVIAYILTDFSGQLRPIGKLDVLRNTQEAALRYFRLSPEDGSPESARNRAVAYVGIGDTYVFQGKIDLATKFLRQGLELASQLAAANPGDPGLQDLLGSAHERLGYGLFISGDLTGSLAQFSKALQVLANDRSDGAQLALAEVHARMHEPLYYRSEYKAASKHLSQSLRILERLTRSHPGDQDLQESLARCHREMATVLSAQGAWEAAFSHVSRSIALAEPLAAANPGHRIFNNVLAQAYAQAGTILAARRDMERGLDFSRKAVRLHGLLLAGDPGSAAAGFNLSNSSVSLARLLLATGNPGEAVEHASRALAIRRRIADATPGNPNSLLTLGEAHDLVASIERALGHDDRAQEEWTRGVEALAPVTEATDRPDLLELYGRMLLALGRIADARPVVTRALATGRASSGFLTLTREARLAAGPGHVAE
jgi:tetratricopeptide (TPR) repeat protein